MRPPTVRATVSRLSDPLLRAGVLLILGALVAIQAFDIAVEIVGRPYPSRLEHAVREWCLGGMRYVPFAVVLVTALQLAALVFALSPRPLKGTTKLAWVPGVVLFGAADLICNLVVPRACSPWCGDAADLCASLSLTGLLLSIGAGPLPGPATVE